MNRRKVLVGSGIAFSTALAGCSSGETGSENGEDNGNESENGGEDKSSEAELSGVYNYRKYDRVTAPDSDDGVYWVSDEETQYVGAQVQLTNKTNGELSLGGYELAVLAGDAGGNITFHAQSNTEPLEAIDTGETVETWLLFTVSPGTEITGFGPTQWAEHSFDLTHDPDLELALEEYEG